MSVSKFIFLVLFSGVRFQYFAFKYDSVVLKTAVSVRFRFGFGFQLSASATQRTMNGFVCFNALQR